MAIFFFPTLLLAAGLAVGAATQAASEPVVSEEEAVKRVEAIWGRVERDETLPGRPVVFVNLYNTAPSDADLDALKAMKIPPQTSYLLRETDRREP